VAFAFAILDEDVYACLKLIKDVRNLFAHPDLALLQPMTFENEDVIKICKKFKGYDPSIRCDEFFGIKMAECLLRLTKDKEEIEAVKKMLSKPARRAAR
jgi:hypothetical protein